MNIVARIRRRTDLTQAQFAERVGTSQPTIAAYEAGRKSPTLRTLDRIVRAVGMELDMALVPPLTREDRRSRELHRAIAQRLVESPSEVLVRARRNLELMRTRHPNSAPLFDRWEGLLTLPPVYLADVLVDPSPWMRELRQVTPFAGVLSADERRAVYRGFAEAEAA